MAKHENDSNRVCTALIVDESDNILMGQRNDNSLFTIPGGHAEKGECPYACMARELKEETGLDAECLEIIKVSYKKEKNLMIYVFKVKIDPAQSVDVSSDPDKECDFWHYKDPNEVKDELHVPIEDNCALKCWIDSK